MKAIRGLKFTGGAEGRFGNSNCCDIVARLDEVWKVDAFYDRECMILVQGCQRREFVEPVDSKKLFRYRLGQRKFNRKE